MSLVQNTQVFFDEITHSYWCGDKELSGVTSLMKRQGLSPDYSDIPEDVLRKAAERGSKVHKDIENFCQGRDFDDTPEVRAFAEAKLNVVENEYLVSDNEFVASSIDVVIKVEGKRNTYSLADIKTTSQLHTDAVRWQLSIYAHLFELQNPKAKVDKLYGLHIRNGVMKIAEVERIPKDEIICLLDCDKMGNQFISSITNPYYIADEPKSGEIADYSKVVALLQAIDKAKAEIKEKEAQIQEVKDAFLAKMEETGVTSIENDFFKVTRIAESKREGVDSTMLKDLYPDIFEQVKKETTVKASVRLTIRKK